MRDYPVVTDAHAHVKTKAEALERIREGIPTMVCGTDPEDARWVMELCHMPEVEGILFPVFGLHPWYADQWKVEDMMPYLEKCQVIGEIGMDSLWCNVPLKRQKEVLEKQLQIAAEWKKPVVLHTKDQEREILELIRKYPNTYLVHWYSADHDLDGYLDLDCYFSVGPDVIWNPAVQQVAKRGAGEPDPVGDGWHGGSEMGMGRRTEKPELCHRRTRKLTGDHAESTESNLSQKRSL